MLPLPLVPLVLPLLLPPLAVLLLAFEMKRRKLRTELVEPATGNRRLGIHTFILRLHSLRNNQKGKRFERRYYKRTQPDPGYATAPTLAFALEFLLGNKCWNALHLELDFSVLLETYPF